jgi:hypothetical protein
MIRIIDKKNGWMSAIYQFFKELFKNLAALPCQGGIEGGFNTSR